MEILTDKEIIDKGREQWSSWSEWEKYIKEYPNSYSFTPEECEAIRKDEYKCGYCHTNIFELDDFPKITDTGEVVCEECYERNFMTRCDLCEDIDVWDDDTDKPFPKSPFYYNYDPKAKYNYSTEEFEDTPAGIYEAIRWPIWSSDMFSLNIYWDAVQLVCTMEDFIKEKEWSKEDFPEGAEYICESCYETAKKIRDNKANGK